MNKRFTTSAMIAAGGILSAILLLVAGVLWLRPRAPSPVPEKPKIVHLSRPARPLPDAFPRDTYRPALRESTASGAVDLTQFSAGRDLVYVNDDRVWWESDHDKNLDDECDHSIHRAMEIPLRRLIELVVNEGGVLEVHDTYRPSGIHNTRSLHKEGRAIDITCDQISLEHLARLCWAAGFDWVYYEASAKGGAHVHGSVRRDGPFILQLARTNGALTALVGTPN